LIRSTFDIRLLPGRNLIIIIIIIIAEAITDAPFVSLKTAGQQNKFKDQMKTPTYSKSHTEEDTPVPTLPI